MSDNLEQVFVKLIAIWWLKRQEETILNKQVTRKIDMERLNLSNLTIQSLRRITGLKCMFAPLEILMIIWTSAVFGEMFGTLSLRP
jgi:hypothetical protein